jgi:uncharacterized protein with ParB-like and HNH nuclease domain
MVENKLELLTIYDLIKDTPFSFYIPSYQRGYRWTDRQVTDLLEDIFEFTIRRDKVRDEFYCLQPVVVKPKSRSWEVIDGQQRLTTIYLLLKYLNNRLAEDYRKTLYTLQYETRIGSGKYLESLASEESQTNVDYFHIHQAYKTIKNWFSNKQNLVNEFEGALLNSTKIIWYEVNENTDSIDIFTRLNIGKIPLTNAELIKALFLFRDNFEGSDETRRLRQFEIAGEWDRIESTLRDKEFWGFISDGNDNYDNRIEFIFDLMSGKTNQDKDFTFRYFYQRFDKINDVEVAWKEVKDYFQTFHEWYNDRELFHLVGYLITVGEKVQTLKNNSFGKTKTAFKTYLKNKIKSYSNLQVYELSYSEASDRRHIKNILLLFNIVSIINNSVANYRFQFGRFKAENWDIEHIHSVKSSMPGRDEHQKDWMTEILLFTQNDELKKRVAKWLETEKSSRTEIFEKIYDDVLKEYSEKGVMEDINDISNLTLLDAGTNRGYKNAVYPIKRNKIIQKDQNGTFIPICTKNVFLKYYNDSVTQMTLWGASDRKSYLNALLNVLGPFLPKQNLSQNQ